MSCANAGYTCRINNINAMQQLHLKIYIYCQISPAPWLSSIRSNLLQQLQTMQMPKDPKWSTSRALTSRLTAGTDMEKFAGKVVKGICVVDTTYGSFGDITDFTLSLVT